MPDRWRAFVLVAAYSTLRFSELVGLRVERLELPRNRLLEEKITEAGHLIAGAPKTERSRRTVTIPDFVTFELAEHLRRCPPGPNGFVFTMPMGGLVRRQMFYHRVWGPALEAAGLQGFRSVSVATRARRWPWRRARTRSWSRSVSATSARGCGTALRREAGSGRQGDRRSAGCAARCGTVAARGWGSGRHPPDLRFFGADDGIRTRDPHLGKVVLYR